jgi:hypothetical protein
MLLLFLILDKVRVLLSLLLELLELLMLGITQSLANLINLLFALKILYKNLMLSYHELFVLQLVTVAFLR